MKVKDSNPKDSVGIKRVPFSTVPAVPIAEVGLAMLEGSLKYGRHNYRAIGVRSSVYYDAAMRHLTRWWEGEDVDPDSGLPHIVKCMASLVVLRDAEINSKLVDDRPPPSPEWAEKLNRMAAELIEKYPEPKEAYTK
ncbi:MAG: dATP/dGTP diphosphohydrolase domain-containing protein [Candidatus Obscuribacterales bacterium]